MNFKDYFWDLAQYNQWANARIYDAVRHMPDEAYRQNRGMFFGSIHNTLNHLIVGDRFWLFRITGEGAMPDSLDQVLYESFDELEAARQEEDRRIFDVLSGFDEVRLQGDLTYSDTKGVVRSKPFIWVWGHIFNHQTHHRGQIHSGITQAGFDAPILDMTYFRENTIEKAA